MKKLIVIIADENGKQEQVFEASNTTTIKGKKETTFMIRKSKK